MRSWPVGDAKARFSELLDTCLSEGPQVVTRRGTEAAVVVSARDWERMQRQRPAPASLKDLLLAEDGPRDLPVPGRGAARVRPAAAFGPDD